MRTRMPLTTVLILVFLGAVPCALSKSPLPDGVSNGYRATRPCGQEQAGYWVVPSATPNGPAGHSVEPYYPEPGDILLYDNQNPVLRIGFLLVGSDAPIHAAIVIERPDGTPAILEVGPNSRPRAFTETYIVDVMPRLEGYHGSIMIRRPRHPLTHEQSVALTKFAEAQEGKSFAVGRLALQGTPFNCRRGLRKMLFARTCFERSRWICSENVVAAATIAGLLDPKVHFANAMYPRDLAFDEQYNLSGTFHSPVVWIAKPNPHIEGDKIVVDKQ